MLLLFVIQQHGELFTMLTHVDICHVRDISYCDGSSHAASAINDHTIFLIYPAVYVPLVLTVMGFLSYLPALLWKFFEGSSVYAVTPGRHGEMKMHLIYIHKSKLDTCLIHVIY